MSVDQANIRMLRALARAAEAGAALRAQQSAGPESRALQDQAAMYSMAADDLEQHPIRQPEER